MELFIDYKIDKIIKEIIDIIIEEHNEFIPYEVVKKIIEQQYLSTIAGFEQGHTIVLKHYGTFVASKKRVDSLNNQYIKRGLKPTLVDNGFMRTSFTKSGELINQSTIETQRACDEKAQGEFKNKFKPVPPPLSNEEIDKLLDKDNGI